MLLEEQHSTSIDREIKLPINNHIFKLSKVNNHIVTAVYNISLTGDQGDGFSETVSMVTTSSLSPDALLKEARREEVLKLGAVIADSDIGMVFCQKCVHIVLREFLEQKVS